MTTKVETEELKETKETKFYNRKGLKRVSEVQAKKSMRKYVLASKEYEESMQVLLLSIDTDYLPNKIISKDNNKKDNGKNPTELYQKVAALAKEIEGTEVYSEWLEGFIAIQFLERVEDDRIVKMLGNVAVATIDEIKESELVEVPLA